MTRSLIDIASTELEREIETQTVRFASLMAMIPPGELRYMLVHQMIGAGTAIIAGAIASSTDPAAARREVEANFSDIIDACLRVHTLATTRGGTVQ